MTLRVNGPNRFDISERTIKVKQVEVNEKLDRSHSLGLYLFAFRFSSFTVCWALAVIGLLQFMVRFCHEWDSKKVFFRVMDPSIFNLRAEL